MEVKSGLWAAQQSRNTLWQRKPQWGSAVYSVIVQFERTALSGGAARPIGAASSLFKSQEGEMVTGCDGEQRSHGSHPWDKRARLISSMCWKAAYLCVCVYERYSHCVCVCVTWVRKKNVREKTKMKVCYCVHVCLSGGVFISLDVCVCVCVCVVRDRFICRPVSSPAVCVKTPTCNESWLWISG